MPSGRSMEVGPFADGGYVWRAGARFPFVVATGVAGVLVDTRIQSAVRRPTKQQWPIRWKKWWIQR